MIGKLSSAVVVAAAAYRDQSGFQQLTGIDSTHMVEDSGSWDTQVNLVWWSFDQWIEHVHCDSLPSQSICPNQPNSQNLAS